MAAVAYAHIEVRGDGVPVIQGAGIKVEEIVLDHLAYGWDAVEIHRQYPHLTLGEIYSALAYYYDHKPEMDKWIDDGLRQVEEMEAGLRNSSVRRKLRAAGLAS